MRASLLGIALILGTTASAPAQWAGPTYNYSYSYGPYVSSYSYQWASPTVSPGVTVVTPGLGVAVTPYAYPAYPNPLFSPGYPVVPYRHNRYNGIGGHRRLHY
jgi:hypothetical protein